MNEKKIHIHTTDVYDI